MKRHQKPAVFTKMTQALSLACSILCELISWGISSFHINCNLILTVSFFMHNENSKKKKKKKQTNKQTNKQKQKQTNKQKHHTEQGHWESVTWLNVNEECPLIRFQVYYGPVIEWRRKIGVPDGEKNKTKQKTAEPRLDLKPMKRTLVPKPGIEHVLIGVRIK